jgi:glycogen synthase
VAHIGRADDSVATDKTESASPPMVLFIGRLEPRKGIDVLLDAIVRVLDEHETVRFVVAGDDRRPGPSGQRWPEVWQSRQLGQGRVEFVGTVSDDDLAGLIRDSTLVVMPSRYESFGLVVAEAMMHGRPAVASDIGGIRELIVDGDTGLLFTVDDADALASAILLLVTDTTRARDMGQRARARFLDHFSIPAATDRLEAVIESAIATDPVRAMSGRA